MASHTAIAAVSRTLQTLLLDRMVTGAAVTLAPPDIEVAGVNGARVNLYLMQVIENAALKNQEIPGQGHPAAYGHPPLSLDLRYLATTHSAMENQVGADLNAQTILGDAMRVMNDFGNRIDHLVITNPVAGTPGDPILDADLAREFERLKIVLHPASLDDITKVWSAVSGTNFRRSVVYEVTVIQIETPVPRVRPQPVETRRIFVTARKRPEIVDAYVSHRARRSDRRDAGADRRRDHHHFARARWPTASMSGSGRPGRSAFRRQGDGRIRIIVPDAQYPIDLDHPAPRPIQPAAQLQPGPLEVQVIAMHPAASVQGGLGGNGNWRTAALSVQLMAPATQSACRGSGPPARAATICVSRVSGSGTRVPAP
ncbi:MAG: DUF4255 domain-containing protein [Hyphomicrobiales bacterium]